MEQLGDGDGRNSAHHSVDRPTLVYQCCCMQVFDFWNRIITHRHRAEPHL